MMTAQTTIRIDAEAFEKAGLRMVDATAEDLELALRDEGLKVRISMMPGHATIEADTADLLAAAAVLHELRLI